MVGCLTSPQLSNLYFTLDNVCNILLIVYSMPYIGSVFSWACSSDADAVLSFPFGGRADGDDVKRTISRVDSSSWMNKRLGERMLLLKFREVIYLYQYEYPLAGWIARKSKPRISNMNWHWCGFGGIQLKIEMNPKLSILHSCFFLNKNSLSLSAGRNNFLSSGWHDL